MNLAYWLNTGWMLKCASGVVSFRRADEAGRAGPGEVLAVIFRRNAECEFGRRHRFSDIKDVGTFQEQVPLAVYEAAPPPSSESPRENAMF